MINRYAKRALAMLASFCLATTAFLAVGSPALAVTTYSYAGASQTYVTTGVAVNVTIARPTVISGNHSLAELAVQSADGQQTIEVGWRVAPAVYGDINPHLFVGYWVNGVFGGYSTNCALYASRTYSPDDSLVGLLGQLKALSIQYSAGKWWIGFAGTYVCSYLETLWTGATPPVASFNQSGKIQMFGEVADTTGTFCDNMGTGYAANDSRAAKFSSATYAQGSAPVSLTTYQTNSLWYTAQLVSGSVRSFYFGGPGDC